MYNCNIWHQKKSKELQTTNTLPCQQCCLLIQAFGVPFIFPFTHHTWLDSMTLSQGFIHQPLNTQLWEIPGGWFHPQLLPFEPENTPQVFGTCSVGLCQAVDMTLKHGLRTATWQYQMMIMRIMVSITNRNNIMIIIMIIIVMTTTNTSTTIINIITGTTIISITIIIFYLPPLWINS